MSAYAVADWESLVATFTEVSRRLLPQTSMRTTLDTVVELAVETLDGCDDAGVTLVRSRQGKAWIETPASYGEIGETADAIQEALSEGPCLQAAWDHERVQVDDLGQEDRWPRFTAQVTELGVRSLLAFRLFDLQGTTGALNMYARRSYAFEARDRHVGGLFASHAAVALAGSLQHDQLREAIATRQVIGQAVGILIERTRCSPEQAFAALRQASQRGNIKLRELAARLVETGQDLEAIVAESTGG